MIWTTRRADLAAKVKRFQADTVTVCLAAADDVADSFGQLGFAQEYRS